MALTFKNLQDEVLAWLDESGETGQVLTVVKAGLNESNSRRVGRIRWPFMLSDVFSFTLVRGTRTYALDETFSRPYYFLNYTKNCLLQETPPREFGTSGPAYSDLHYGDTRFSLIGQTLNLLYDVVDEDGIDYQFYKMPTEMVSDNDYPDIPYPYSRILVWDTLLMMGVYNEDISAAKMKLWSDRQQELETSLMQAYQEGQSLGARTRHIVDAGW